MRTFEIYVDEDKVACDKLAMHVPPNHIEDIAVYLKTGLEEKYTLDNLVIEKDKKNCLTPQRLNSSTIILRDDNVHGKKSKPKFSVKLTPRKIGDKTPETLDPIIVNE